MWRRCEQQGREQSNSFDVGGEEEAEWDCKALFRAACDRSELQEQQCTMRLSMKIKETKILKSKNSFYAHF